MKTRAIKQGFYDTGCCVRKIQDRVLFLVITLGWGPAALILMEILSR